MNADAVRKGILYSDRAQGQIGETNRFAQSMLVLLPLAIAAAFAGKSIPVRIAAATAGLLIFLGMLTTYSRGAIVAVAAMTIPMLLFRLIRLRTVLVTGVAAFLIIGIVTPMFIDRIASIAGLQGLFVENSERQPDTVTKKRLTEMTAALFTFLDHPMLGVGPGQYTPFYSLKYQTDPEASFEVVDRPRRAHSLYAEMAAETGIVGITMFLVVVGALMYQLQDVAARVQRDRPELAWMARAFWVGIFGYLAAAVFLHLAFQRYYWLLLALAGAMVNVIQHEIELQKDRQEL
jgi:O-antigen ligase